MGASRSRQLPHLRGQGRSACENPANTHVGVLGDRWANPTAKASPQAGTVIPAILQAVAEVVPPGAGAAERENYRGSFAEGTDATLRDWMVSV